MVADQACASVDRLRVAALGFEIGLGAKDKEAARGGVSTQALEAQIAPIHSIEGPRLGDQVIQHVDLVEFAVADEDERRNVAAHLQEGVQFDRRVGRAKRRPGKHRQTQVDRGGIEGVDRLLQVEPKGFGGVEPTSRRNQALPQLAGDAPVARGIGQGVACPMAADPQVIQLGSLHAQTCFDVAQLSRYVSCQKAMQRY